MFRFVIERLQLPQNASKVTPIISPLLHHSGRKTYFHQVQSPSSLPAPDPEKLLTVSYLESSCGLSSTAAQSATKFVRNKSKERSVSVIQLLKRYGFSDAQIDTIVIHRAQLLVADPEKNLKPKLDFLLGEGFSKEESADILTANFTLLGRNLERGLMSTYRFLTSVLSSRSDVVRALRSGNQCVTADNEPNIKMLRANGVPESVILYLLKRFPMALMRSTDRLEEAVKKLIEMGFDPGTKMFGQALGHISFLSKETWLRKMKLLQELGWSEAEAFGIFKKQPSSICMSDEQLRFRVDFFKKSIGWDRAFIAMCPAVLQLSIQNRIIPRVSVLKVLMSKDLIKKEWTQYQFYCNEDKFLGRYVKKYAAMVPEITETYHAHKEKKCSV